jgi:hypothetical protein
MNLHTTPARHHFALNLFTKSKRARMLASCAAAGAALMTGFAAHAQVTAINSAIVTPRVEFSTNLAATKLTAVTNYPSLISFSETNAATTNSAFSPIQDLWQFAIGGQTNAYVFSSNDSFTVSMDVTLTGNPIAPRKEAGFAFNDVGGNINGQYILDTDGHEVVAFGGSLPFWAGPLNHAFNSGQTVTMGITIFKDVNGNQALVYSAASGGTNTFSQTFEINPPMDQYTLGGYFQLQGQGITNGVNNGSASFANISIAPVPHLNVALAGNQPVIYWTGGATNFLLQSSTNLSSTNWTYVSNAVPIVGFAVTNNSPATFFRLVP